MLQSQKLLRIRIPGGPIDLFHLVNSKIRDQSKIVKTTGFFQKP